MTRERIQKYWHELFELGVLIKGLNGLWETAGGLLFLFLSRETLSRWFLSVMHNELLEDPHDKIINFFSHSANHFSSGTKTFVALYILLHGILNIFLAIQLYRDRHWAYLVAIGAMSTFVLYQLYRISVHHSPVLMAVTIFDICFIALTWHEYRYHQEVKKA
ncbi:MAG: DUF2127 domain-containing protein [Candidatus Paceibacterota bacterium]|jgi:uncharacterized membrane protein